MKTGKIKFTSMFLGMMLIAVRQLDVETNQKTRLKASRQQR